MSGDDDITEWSPERIEDALGRDVPTNVMMDAPIAERLTAVLKGFLSWVLEETRAPKGEITKARKSLDRHGKRFIEICGSTEAAALRDAMLAYAGLAGLERTPIPMVTVDHVTDAEPSPIE